MEVTWEPGLPTCSIMLCSLLLFNVKEACTVGDEENIGVPSLGILRKFIMQLQIHI